MAECTLRQSPHAPHPYSLKLIFYYVLLQSMGIPQGSLEATFNVLRPRSVGGKNRHRIIVFPMGNASSISHNTHNSSCSWGGFCNRSGCVNCNNSYANAPARMGPLKGIEGGISQERWNPFWNKLSSIPMRVMHQKSNMLFPTRTHSIFRWKVNGMRSSNCISPIKESEALRH